MKNYLKLSPTTHQLVKKEKKRERKGISALSSSSKKREAERKDGSVYTKLVKSDSYFIEYTIAQYAYTYYSNRTNPV